MCERGTPRESSLNTHSINELRLLLLLIWAKKLDFNSVVNLLELITHDVKVLPQNKRLDSA